MIRALVTLLVVAPLAVAAPPSKGTEAKSPLTLEASLSGTGDGGRVAFLSVRLVAAGDAVVMTERLTAVVEQTETKSTVTLRPADRKDAKGRSVIPIASALGGVSLRPDEVASVTVPNTADVHNVTSAAAAGKVELTVVYEVPDAWAKRFGLTAAEARGVATIAEPKEKPADRRP
ncbi:hypothetical protein [Limnoglobus roseus]|nr:hypothetical protein [Limnoglobus roseus]